MKDSQLAIVDGQVLTEKDVMEAIDLVIVDLHQTGNLEKATNALETMERVENVSGHGKARLLYGMRDWWEDNDQSNKRNMEFVDYIEGKNILKKVSIDRYLVVQEHIENHNIPKEFHSRPIRELVPIAKALQQGYGISKAVWRKLLIANGQGDVNRIIREEVKRKQPRKNVRQYVIERDGSLYGWKNDHTYYRGYIELKTVNDTDREMLEDIIAKLGARMK